MLRKQDTADNFVIIFLDILKTIEDEGIFPSECDRGEFRVEFLVVECAIHSVVQPDVCVICNPEILDKQGCNGAPDWIIEILSKGNSKREMQRLALSFIFDIKYIGII